MHRASWHRRLRVDAERIKCQAGCRFLDPSFPQQQRLPAGGVFEVRAFGAEGPAEGVVGVRGFGGVAVVEQDGEFQRAAGLPFAVGEVFQGERDFHRDGLKTSSRAFENFRKFTISSTSGAFLLSHRNLSLRNSFHDCLEFRREGIGDDVLRERPFIDLGPRLI